MDALTIGNGSELRFDLTRGFVTVVDAELFEQERTYYFRGGRVATFRPSAISWIAARNRKSFYAFARVALDGTKVTLALHRLLIETPRGFLTDHISGDTMDNRRRNLRVCNQKQIARNMIHLRPGSSRFRGVCKRPGGWQAQLHMGHPHDRVMHLGYFDNEEDAARAWDAAARIEHGEFCRLNFPNEHPTSQSS